MWLKPGAKRRVQRGHFLASQWLWLFWLPGLATSPTFGVQHRENQDNSVALNRVELQIVDEDSQPIANASVIVEFKTERDAASVYDPQIREARSDSEGKVSTDVGNDEVWVLMVHIEAEGKTPHRIFSGRTGDRSVEFPFKRQVVMKVGQSITCMVEDYLGNPVANAVCRLEISPQESIWPTIPERRFVFGEFVSDQDGKAVLSQVPVDQKDVFIPDEGAAFSEPVLIVDHPDHFGPLEVDIANQSGDLVVQFPKSAIISGRVTDQDGKPVKSANVRFGHCVAGAELPSAKTDVEGSFEIRGCYPGTTCLTVEVDGYAPQMKKVTAQLGNPQEVNFRLTNGRTVAGKLVDTKGSPVKDARISCVTWQGWNLLTFESTSNDEGEFVWEHAPIDDVEFEVESEGLLIDRMTVDSRETELVTHTMWPTFEISGKITDAETGEPLEEAFGSFAPSVKPGIAHMVHYGKVIGEYRHRFNRVASVHYARIFSNTHESFPIELDYRKGDQVVDVAVRRRDRRKSRFDNWPDMKRRLGEGRFSMQQQTALKQLHELGAEIRAVEYSGRVNTMIQLTESLRVKYGRDGSKSFFDDPEKELWKGASEDLLSIGDSESSNLHLTLTGWRFSKSVFEALRQIGPIEQLELTGVWDLEPDEYEALEGLMNVKTLSINVYGDDPLPPSAWTALARLPNLEGLILRGANDIDVRKQLDMLVELSSMKQLRISAEVDSSAMNDIASMAKIESLELYGPFTGSDLGNLPNKGNLKSINLRGSQLGSESLFHLFELCPALEQINVDLKELDRRTVRLLSQRPLQNLQRLKVPMLPRSLAVQLQNAHPDCGISMSTQRNSIAFFKMRPSEKTRER